MSTRAEWVEGIPDLYEQGRLDEVATFYTDVQVSQQTGFSQNTILGALSRPKITSASNPLGPISRPATRIGSKPLYSAEQIEQVKALRGQVKKPHFGGQDEPLPSVTFEEAKRSEMASAIEIAEHAGVHEQSVRAWSRNFADFPKPVATRERSPDKPYGAPSVVYELRAVLHWMHMTGKLPAKTS